MAKRFTIQKNKDGDWEVTDPPGLDISFLKPHMRQMPDELVRLALWRFLQEAEEYRPKLEGYALDDLEDVRTQVFAAIDNETGRRIVSGFKFEDKVFSLSNEAQSRYLSLKLDADKFEYPIPINTLDDRDVLDLESPEQTRAFCDAARDHILRTVGEGSVLKKDVRELQTEEELRAFKDPRT